MTYGELTKNLRKKRMQLKDRANSIGINLAIQIERGDFMVLVIGAGKSGRSAEKLLKTKGYGVLVYDDLSPVSVDGDFEFCVKSPGVPPYHRVVRNFVEKGIEVIGEVELAYRYSRGKILSITGTNGKSTVTAMVYHVLSKRFDSVFVGGNFGRPFSDFCLYTGDDSFSVLELSSFQIEDLSSFSSNSSVLLNITPDHLDRYESFEDYVSSKLKLIEHTSGDVILNLDDPVLSECKIKNSIWFSMKREADVFFDGKFIKYGEKEVDVNYLPLNGYHNIENYMASFALLCSAGVDFDFCVESLLDFKGLEHRMENVAKIKGVNFINDSKSTNVDSLRKAILSLDEIILIAGGKDKGLDFSPLKGIVKERVKAVVAIGETKEKFFDTFSDVVDVVKAETLEDAVYISFDLAEGNGTVLFSPGCSSYDMFSNFEERGKKFKEIVFNLRESIEV